MAYIRIQARTKMGQSSLADSMRKNARMGEKVMLLLHIGQHLFDWLEYRSSVDAFELCGPYELLM